MSRFLFYCTLWCALCAVGLPALHAQIDYSEVYSESGKHHYANGDFELAIDFFSLALEKRPDDLRTLFNRGQAYLRLPRPKKHRALMDFNAILTQNPVDEQVLRIRANLLYDLKEYPAALNDYNRLLDFYPDNPEIHSNRASVLAELGMTDEANTEFVTALEYNNESAQIWINKGQAAMKQKNYADAIYSFSKAVEKEPSNTVPRYFLAKALIKEKKYAHAKDHLNTILNMDPQDDATIYSLLAECYLWEENIQEASLWAEKAKQTELQNPEAYHVLGMIAYYQRDFEGATQHFNDCIKFAPEHELAYLNVAKSYYQLGLYEQAEQSIIESIRVDSTNGETYYMRALIHHLKGNTAEICIDFLKAKSLGYETAREDFEYCNE